MEIQRHVRRRTGGCYCCSSAYELEDEYPAVLQNRISADEWRLALCDLNHIVHRHGPSPGLWSLVLLLAFLPLCVLIPLLLNLGNGVDFFQIWIWVLVGQFFLWMSLSIALVARNRRFIHALDAKVEQINHAWHGRGVRVRMCHHHHHHGYSRRFHHAELVVTVEGVQVVSTYQSPLVVHPHPPVYGTPVVVQHQQAPQHHVQQQGFAMPAGYAPVPSGPSFQAPPPGYEMQAPPPGYFEKGPAPPVYDASKSDFN